MDPGCNWGFPQVWDSIDPEVIPVEQSRHGQATDGAPSRFFIDATRRDSCHVVAQLAATIRVTASYAFAIRVRASQNLKTYRDRLYTR